jgi:hypothetical protein
MVMRVAVALLLAFFTSVVSTGRLFPALQARQPPQSSNPFDGILDLYVRDGMVYYQALKTERSRLDAHLNRIAGESVDGMSRDERLAFWLNAYNALVLRTVIDHYPIHGRSAEYPANSIRQIPGAFEQLSHRVANRSITLDQIEQTILSEFHDPRVYLALGRGSLDGGRLRSEAFTAARLETQLAEVASECTSRVPCMQIDRNRDTLAVSAIFSWREKDFVAAFASPAPPAFAARSPIERAVIAFLQPRLLASEKEFLAGNDFRLVFRPYDWGLNDLTGRGGR